MTATPFTVDEVEAWRARFPILDTCTYLINNSLGAMPEGVADAMAEYAHVWARRGVEAWQSDWLPLVADVSRLLEDLLGAPADSVVVHQNVSTLTGMALSALDFTPERDGVVMAGTEWSSHRYLVGEHERSGARLHLVPDAELLDAIDERTRLVIVSHAHYATSAIRDVAAVSARARDVGAMTLVDGYHALGHMPVDVSEIGCDFYVGGSVKWLCGGPGVGYLYVEPGLERELRPRQVGWLGHAEPFSFADQWQAAEGAMGWLGGTPSIPALYAAREGYRAVIEAGPARIRATSKLLTACLVEGASARGWKVRTPLEPERRAGAVTIDLGEQSHEVGRGLVREGIIVDSRPGAGIRLGPHFFNSIDECEAALTTIDGLR